MNCLAVSSDNLAPSCTFDMHCLPGSSLIFFHDMSCQVKRRNSEESSTQWTTGIAEVQLPIEYDFMEPNGLMWF